METLYCLVIVLAVFAGKGEAIACYECLHIDYSSSSSLLQEFLEQIGTVDPNCRRHGDEYIRDYTVSCANTCFKEYGTIDISYLGSSVTVDFAGRGCAPFFLSDQCQRVTTEELFEEYGVTVTSESVEGCYCNTDECNYGNHVHAHLLGVLFFALMVLRAVY